MDDALDPRALGRLKWRCRRGLLENDLFVERFFARHGHALTPRLARGLEALMALADNDLLDLLLRRTEPTGDLDRAEVREVLDRMRQPLAGAAQGDVPVPPPSPFFPSSPSPAP